MSRCARSGVKFEMPSLRWMWKELPRWISMILRYIVIGIVTYSALRILHRPMCPLCGNRSANANILPGIFERGETRNKSLEGNLE